MDGLEDGELDFDDIFDIYTPLERPTHNNARPPKKVVVESDHEDDPTSSSDSDSSVGERTKPKIKKKMKPTQKTSDSREDSNRKIWRNVLEADVLSSTVSNCVLDQMQSNIRGLKPYTYRYANNNHKDFNGRHNYGSGKRNHHGNYVNERKSFKGNEVHPKKGAPKNILPLDETACDTNEKLAHEIADKLNEVKEDLILKAIQIAGKERIISVFEEVREAEKSGGMLIMNGSRRRTSGGVFFFLLKKSTDIPREQLRQIFEVDKQAGASGKKKVTKPVEEGECPAADDETM